MERWYGALAVVTDASSHVGGKISEILLKSGINVVGIGDDVEIIQELKEKFLDEKSKIYPINCDLSNNESLMEIFTWIEGTLGPISIIINNAEVWYPDSLLDGDYSKWKRTVDVNILAVCQATQLAIKSMERAGINGYVININSVLTYYLHNLPKNIPHSLYIPSKFALTALTEGLRKELINKESRIKVSSVSLGLVETESLEKLEHDEINEIPKLQTEDVANTILYLLGTPAHVQVHDVIVRAIGSLI